MKDRHNKMNIKRILCLLAALCMVVVFMPMTVHAAGYGDKGYDTTNEGSFEIDGNKVFTYVTGTGGTIERISGGNSDSTQQYKAVAFDNWEFAYWSTYYVGPSTQDNNPVAVLGYYYFSKPGDKNTVFNKTNPIIQVNEEMWAAGVFYLQAIFKPKVSVSVNRDLPASATSIRGKSSANNGFDNVFISGNSGYVPYGGAVEVTLTAFKEDYIVQSISVHDGAPINDFTYEVNTEHNQLEVFFTVTRPTNVNINVKIKEQIVSFDANGGSGTMTAQTFESGVEKTLPANAFEKAGYLFNGWNTKPNGSGTSYSDKQAVTFSPANDGDRIILYAQWEECTEHDWKNGVCDDCGLVCEHSYTYSAAGNVITESCRGGCDHNATAALELKGSVSTVYTGDAIEALKVEYSDSWKGGELKIAYTDNINAGEASGSITKGDAKAAKTFTIEKAAAPSIVFPIVENEITYGQQLKDAKLSFYRNECGIFNWTAPIGVPESTDNYAMDFYPNEQALQNYDWANGDWLSINGQWIDERNAVCVCPEVIVNKADGIGSVSIEGWTYGDAPNIPVCESTTNGIENVAYSYKVKGADDSTYTADIPTEAGEYTLRAVFAATDHYTEAVATADFEIIDPPKEPDDPGQEPEGPEQEPDDPGEKTDDSEQDLDESEQDIDEPEQAAKTGDDSNLVLWIILMLTSGCAIIMSTVIGKKRNA